MAWKVLLDQAFSGEKFCLEAHQIVAGFSDIKTQFRTKLKIKRPLIDLRLWFTFADDALCIHDYHDHKKKMIAALYNSKTGSWRILVDKGTKAELLMLFVTKEIKPAEMQNGIRGLYSLFGYFKTGRR